MTFNEERLGEFMGTMVGYMTGGALCFSVWLGDELGLYRAMAGAGALSADDVAKRAECNPRLVREWLDGQVAGGLIGYEAGERLLRAVTRSGDGARRRLVAGLRRAGHERVRVDVHGHRQDQGRVPG